MVSNQAFTLYGKIVLNIFEPSNGGTGIKLNTPKPMSTIMVDCIIVKITIPNCDSLNAIRNGIENKHTYFVEVNTGTAGVVDQINVYYDKDKAPAGGGSTT